MSAFIDPRVRMRDALRELVTQEPATWDRPSLVVLRNRLLDYTGSDARPLADLLIEALRRGFRDRLPDGASNGASNGSSNGMNDRTMESARWDALIAPFVMQWSAERFVQPDMARWAVECWGYAMHVIQPEQLRIAPPPKPESLAGLASRLQVSAAAKGAQAAQRVGLQLPATPRRPIPAKRVRAATLAATPRPYTVPAPRPSSYSASRSAQPPVNPWIARGLVGALTLMGVGMIASVAFTASAAEDTTSRAGAAPVAIASTLAPTPSTPTMSTPTMSVPTVSNQLVPQSLTGGVSIMAPANPGVTTITRAMLPTGADSARMLFVDPARRAVGESRRMNVPNAGSAALASIAATATYDEVHLEDGTTMRGRVEIVRAGAVIFRDLRTGLRHELRKEEISEIITEFGTAVRFRANVAGATGAPRSRAVVAEATKNGLRARGLGGAYRVRYDAPVAVGSRECASVWTRAPDATDRAVVRHIAGADTLVLAFDAGDNFPSNVDPDGFFASTFRIVPDQARTSTALTTRLTGQFRANGTLALTVNIVFFRRMRSGADLACTVTVKAEGQREG